MKKNEDVLKAVSQDQHNYKNEISKDKQQQRRKVVTSLGGGILAAGNTLPDSWSKPIVNSLVLPAHAQTTGADQEAEPDQAADPCLDGSYTITGCEISDTNLSQTVSDPSGDFPASMTGPNSPNAAQANLSDSCVGIGVDLDITITTMMGNMTVLQQSLMADTNASGAALFSFSLVQTTMMGGTMTYSAMTGDMGTALFTADNGSTCTINFTFDNP